MLIGYWKHIYFNDKKSGKNIAFIEEIILQNIFLEVQHDQNRLNFIKEVVNYNNFYINIKEINLKQVNRKKNYRNSSSSMMELCLSFNLKTGIGDFL